MKKILISTVTITALTLVVGLVYADTTATTTTTPGGQ